MGHSGQVTSLHNLFVFSFHIPIFFIISGYLFAEKNYIELSPGDIAYKKFKRLILPYLVTGLIIFLLQLVIFFYRLLLTYYSFSHNFISSIISSIDYSFPSLLYDGMQYSIKLFYGTGKEAVLFHSVIEPIGILWFLPSLFCAIITFYSFLKLFDKYSITIQLIIIILLTSAGYMIGNYFILPWSIDISLVSQIFVFGGYMIRRHMIIEKKASLWLLIAAVVIWCIDLYMGGMSMNDRLYNNPVVSIIGAIAASYLLIKLSYFLSNAASFYYKAIDYIGKQSLLILCFSLMDTLACSPIISYFALTCLYQNNHWIILTGFRLCYSLLIAEIIKFLPLLKFVYYPKNSMIIEEGTIRSRV